MSWIDECINGYYNWLRDRTEVATDPQTGWAMISTPFPALFGDTVNIYIKKEGNKYLLSDDGETVSNLQNIGIDIVRSQKKKAWRDEMLVNYGLVVNGDELTITANKDNLFQKKHSLMCAISDLYSLAGAPYSPMIATIQERIEKAKKIPKPDKVDNYLNSMREDDVINAVDNELSI